MTETILIESTIGRDDLDELIAGLEAACGGNRIVVNDAYKLEVNDTRQVAALRALFPADGSGGAPAKRGRKNREALTIARANKPKIGAHSYQIEGTDEIISAQALNKRLTNNDMARGTILIGKKGRFIVAPNPAGGPFVLEAVQ